MLMVMSNAEKWLSHTKYGHFLKKDGRRAPCPAFLKNGHRALALDIFLKNLRPFD